jgi:Fe2+ or Zn2+ uptake regulation protein
MPEPGRCERAFCVGLLRHLVSEILSELHDFRSAPGIHPALRERVVSVGRATADRDLVLLVTGDV